MIDETPEAPVEETPAEETKIEGATIEQISKQRQPAIGSGAKQKLPP